MENIILGDRLEGRQDTPSESIPSAIVAPGATGAPGVVSVYGGSTTTTGFSTLPPTTTNTVVSTAPASSSQAAQSSSAAGSSSTSNQTLLIAILVPICVLLAAVPTAAYLIYMRRRDRRQREEAEMQRGRDNHSSSGATGEALLMRRSISASSQQERKLNSVSSTELETAADGVLLEKSLTNISSRRENNNSTGNANGGIFAPAAHGPAGRRSPPSNVSTQPRPGFKSRLDAEPSPTLPPLDFGKDDAVSISSLTAPTGTSPPSTSPSKPTVPATLPTFAPTQPKQRAPNLALAPGRQGGPSPTPADNPSWPLPSGGLRDSASTYSSAGNERPSISQSQSRPQPSGLSKEIPKTSAAAMAARQQQQQQKNQPGPRESSIAYGIPPVPPSPVAESSMPGDRRSGASRKRDSDAVSELSYSASMRGRRDTRRDTDAISVISAMSQQDR